MHAPALLVTLAIAFGLAFVLGFAATRLRLPPLVGYLLAGVVVGPFTPGYVADGAAASQLAEFGVILLMFGVGLHFSPRDLLAARRLALPGALAQMAVTTALGATLAAVWGWSVGAALVFGLSLAVASTVVVLKALEARGLGGIVGRTAIGWLVVQDLATVLALVLVPALAGGPASAGLAGTIALTLGKVAAFVALMAIVGRRAVPWLLTRVARAGSRELFTLAVLAVALGIAVGAATLFGVSVALGAFFAGVVISESDLSYQAGADALPLQDAFAVLFFVSVGMLFDPQVLVREPLRVLATVAVVVAGNAVVSFALLLGLRTPVRPALQVAAGLGQIGEFSFILAGLGVTVGLLPGDARDLVLAAALVTITINPLLFAAAGAIDGWFARRPALVARLEQAASRGEPLPVAADASTWRDHAIVVGAGRVGGTISDALSQRGLAHVVIEQDRRLVEALRRRGAHAIFGDATRPAILAHAYPEHARLLVVATPEGYHTRRIVELARHSNPAIDTVVRTHGAEAQAYFERLGVGRAVMGERELALGMADYALRALGCGDAAADATVAALRATDAR